jgi:hypothetical protein
MIMTIDLIKNVFSDLHFDKQFCLSAGKTALSGYLNLN